MSKTDRWCYTCALRERCGRGDSNVDDMSTTGFVDGVEFPPEAVETYIRAHEDAVVPPTVAAVHPDIIDRLDADDEPWVCEACNTQYAYSAVEADTAGERPVCPKCADRGALAELHAGGGEPAG